MNRDPKPLLAAALAVFLLPSSSPAQAPAKRYVDTDRAERETRYLSLSSLELAPPLAYRLWFERDTNKFVIRLSCAVRRGGDACIVMPAWSPGSYRIADNGKHVQDLRASVAGEAVALERVDENAWRVRSIPAGPLAIKYRLDAKRFAQRTIGGRRAGAASYQLDGPKIWVHEIRHKRLPCTVSLQLPDELDVATGLRPAKGTEFGRADAGSWRFDASDYDVLIDCPTRLGRFESFGFRIGEVPFEIALSGAERLKTDRQEFARRVKLLSKHFIDFFGDAPFDRYVYLFTVPGGGGLEHLNSTTIGLMSLEGSRPGRPVIWDFVIAHEFFHLWNVKRLRPRALGPFDYTGPNRTTALWFAEGVTSYYGTLCLPRVGLTEARDYWRHLSSKFSQLRNDRRRKLLSVADSSWQVWDGAYLGTTRRIDYYLKGECLGALLDVLIRDATNNERSLDDVMRAMYEATRTSGVGFAEDDIRETCERIAGRGFEEFFARYVYGTEDLPVETVMPKAGLKVDVSGSERRTRLRLSEDPGASEKAVRIRSGLIAGTTS